jgi:hypothetical protein
VVCEIEAAVRVANDRHTRTLERNRRESVTPLAAEYQFVQIVAHVDAVGGEERGAAARNRDVREHDATCGKREIADTDAIAGQRAGNDADERTNERPTKGEENERHDERAERDRRGEATLRGSLRGRDS